MPLYENGVEITEAMVAKGLAAMMGNDPTLPQDRPDPEREWVFPGTASPDKLKPGAQRGMTCVEWAGKDRTIYTIEPKWKGPVWVFQVWVWGCYPKDQWSEEEARAFHEDRVAKITAEYHRHE